MHILDSRNSILSTVKYFYSRFQFQTVSDLHLSYLVTSGAIYPRMKWDDQEAVRSPPSGSEVNNSWIYTHMPLFVFIVWQLSSDFKILFQMFP
jgi:hypothetical protein